MSDNIFGYSNSGMTQSLNGISTITDGSGASITDGNAIFIDTNTNTATINNNLTIPLSSLITLYGNIYLPAYNITLTPSDISAIGNLSGLTTRVSNVETKTTRLSYDTPNDTTTTLGNTIFGPSGLATYTTMRINSDIILPSTVNIIQNSIITPTTNLKNLPYLDASSSIQTQINNITSNYLTISSAASTYGKLASSNTWTQSNTFNSPVIGSIDNTVSTSSTIYNSLTTGSITIGNSLTTGTINIANNTTFSGNLNICSIRSPSTTSKIYIGNLANDIYLNSGLISIGVALSTISINGATTFNSTMTGNLTGNCSGSSGSCTGNALTSSSCTTATTATNISLTTDTTNTNLYIPFTTSSATITSAALKINSNLKYNANTNTLTANIFNGNITGNITGSIDGNSTTSYNIYPSLTTGNIFIGGGLTTGIIKIGVNTQTGSIQIGSLNNTTYISGNHIDIGYLSSNPINLIGNVNINGNTTCNGVNSQIVDPNSVSTGTSSIVFSKIIISGNGEISYMFSGLNLYMSSSSGRGWSLIRTTGNNISDICCSYTGQYLYYCTTGINKPVFSSNFGSTFSTLSIFNPGPGSQKIGCSYDGSIFCLVSGFSSPAFYFAYISLNYGSTISYSSGGFTANTKTINSVAVYGYSGILINLLIACGTPTNFDYVYSGNSPSGSSITISSITSLGQSNWKNIITKSNNNFYLSDAGNSSTLPSSGYGLWVSTDQGTTFSSISYTSNKIALALDNSYDNLTILFSDGTYFYSSVDGGTSFSYSGSSLNIKWLAMSAMAKTTLMITSTPDTVYISPTNQELIFNNDLIMPKNRLTLQSNTSNDYTNNIYVYYPYRTSFLTPSTTNIISIYFPLYENYVINNLAATTTFNLPQLSEQTVGLKITVVKLSAQILTITPTSPNLIFAFNVYTGASSYALPATASSCILLSSYGTSTSNFCWIIISQA